MLLLLTRFQPDEMGQPRICDDGKVGGTSTSALRYPIVLAVSLVPHRSRNPTTVHLGLQRLMQQDGSGWLSHVGSEA